MAKDIYKLDEIKVLDGILQVMLDEHLDITEHNKNRENYSTYQSIFEKVKNNYGNEVTNNELAFRKLWYTLKGSNYIENVKEDHLKTYKITGDGITFIIIGGYEKRYKNGNWQSKANKSTVANVIASFVIGFTAICILYSNPLIIMINFLIVS